MSYLEKIAEERIKKAIEKGEFDHLEGFGKPVDNSDYFNAPPDERIAWHILKNAGVVPEEVDLRKQIYHLSTFIRKETNPEQLRKEQEEMEKLKTRLLFTIEKRQQH